MPLATAVRHYLHDILGVPLSEAKPWPRERELPYFLKDAFEYKELDLLKQPILLALIRAERRPQLSDVRTWVEKVRAMADRPVVYVTDALASYERRRLIEHKVPFIVPGNQLYLPDLGLDLREYFRQRAPTGEEALSPSAQAMLVSTLLRPTWTADWQPSAVAQALGYTAMTLSRVVKELTSAGLASAYTVGRTRWLRTDLSPGQLWQQAMPRLRSPVRRSLWVLDAPTGRNRSLRLAGQSALALHSMLVEPKYPVHALGPADWKRATEAGIHEAPEPVAGAREWQLWSYSPALVPDSLTVDPLSLILSLQHDSDDRIQIALDELKAKLPW
jgi:hypothetical protein